MSGYDVFSLREIFGGKPRNLYTFLRGDRAWRYTSAGRVVTIDFSGTPIDFTPALISRDQIQRGQDTGAMRVHIKIARTVPVADQLRRYSTLPMDVGIHRWQADADAGMLPPLQHFGSVSNVTLNEAFVECDVVSREGIFGNLFPSKGFGTLCPLGTYTGRCGVDERLFTTDTTILSIDRSTVVLDLVPMPTVTYSHQVQQLDGDGNPMFDFNGDPVYISEDVMAEAPDGWYDAGQILWEDPDGNGTCDGQRERVFIEKHTANTFTIMGRVPDGAAVGDAVKVIAGDDHSLATCRGKFNNVRNFLGFDQLPLNDPMRTRFIA